ncbi:MAG: hypothetical protein AB7V44_26375, partial [Pseudonocardia sp.]
PRWARWAAPVAVAVVVVLNGAAEVFLGQHRLSDVVASWAAGLAILAVVAAVAAPGPAPTPSGAGAAGGSIRPR